MALVLSQRGVGTFKEILRMPTDLVMEAWDFGNYAADYAETEAALNHKEPAQ